MSLAPAPHSRPKITVIGTGQIGAVVGLLAGMKQLGDVTFFDVLEGIPEGKGLDLMHASAVEKFDCRYTGSREYARAMQGADVIIVTAGVPRKPGMSRDALLEVNAKIVTSVAEGIRDFCPRAFVICITNPLDAMTHLLQKVSGLPSNMVVGMAGLLDASRCSALLSEKLKVSVDNIQVLVMGGHGDTMVLLPRYATVGGIPLPTLVSMGWITQTELDAIVERTRNSGAEIVQHLKTGSAFFAPAASAVKMAEAFLYDRKSLMSCATQLNGEYGVQGLYVGVPVIIGRGGVERVVQLPLTNDEASAFQHSVHAVKELVDAIDKLGTPHA